MNQIRLGHQSLLNRIWSETLLEELTRFGVDTVCIAPGSRSTPLVLEANANPNLTLHTHFDERGLGFLALGMAKAHAVANTKSPKIVAVIVTSGTAVANLLPAIVEANLIGERLIILTADRPPELIECGANQAIDQVDIFSKHVTASLNLPSPTASISLNWLLMAVDKVMDKQRQLGGVVHINCPFPEPLYAEPDRQAFVSYLATIQPWRESSKPYMVKCDLTLSYECALSSVASSHLYSTELGQYKGVVVVGSVTLCEAKKARQFAQYFGWPLFCDPQSGISSEWAHYDIWLQNPNFKALLNDCDCIVQFGQRVISKRLNQWIAEQVSERHSRYLYISPRSHTANQNHLVQTQIVAPISAWVDHYCSDKKSGDKTFVLNRPTMGWGDKLKAAAELTVNLASTHLCNPSLLAPSSLTEMSIVLDLAEQLDGHDLFLGNSLIARLVDMFSSLTESEVFSNRGASGIDGLVATAVGVQRQRQRPMVVMLGDLSLLYDLNSLALLAAAKPVVDLQDIEAGHIEVKKRVPMVIIVTNNDGGAIFDLLPVPAAQKQALYQQPHGFDFRHAAKQFRLAYCQPTTQTAFREQLAQHLTQGEGTLIVEIKTPAQQASHQLKQLLSQLQHLHDDSL